MSKMYSPDLIGQRYRVFLNDKSILISDNDSELNHKSVNKIVEFTGMEGMRMEYEQFKLNRNLDQLIFLSKDQFYAACGCFQSMFIEIKAAGGLVRNLEGSLLFIRRFETWDLPKGKIEKDEIPSEAAIREVLEETGLPGVKLIRPIPSTFHIYSPEPNESYLKETFWFEMLYDGNKDPVPQTEESITQAKWFRPEQLDTLLMNTYSSLKEIIKEFLK